eukprot:gene10814-13248_t
MLKVALLSLALLAVCVLSQTPSPNPTPNLNCNSYNTYSYAFTSVGFNFLRKDYLLSYSESGDLAVDVPNQRSASFFIITFNNTEGVPMFETGQTLRYGSNNTAYVITNGYCFQAYDSMPFPTNLIPPNVKYVNQVTIGSSLFNTYYAQDFDGQHSFVGIYEQSTCIPITFDMKNIDDTLGVANTNIFEFTTSVNPGVFTLPPQCYQPNVVKIDEYNGHRSTVEMILSKF